MMRARGVAARGGGGGARLLAAATCWTRRHVSRPRPARASPWVLGCDGEVEGPSCLGAFTGVLELMSPFLGFGL